MILKMKKFGAFTLSLLILFVLFSTLAHAQPTGGGNPPTGGGNPNPISINFPNPFSGGDSLFGLLRTIVNNIILPIGGVVAVLAFIYAGFLYVTAQGNESKLATAHKALLYTSIGTAVLLGSWVLANAICSTINQLGGPICQTQ
jgi:hypothetical protein